MQLLHTVVVSLPAQSQRIDVFLSTKLRKFSRNKILNLVHKQAVLVNEKAVAADYHVKPGDIIQVFSPFKEYNENITAENIPLEIIYEDESVIVINKPSGMPVHKGLGNYKGTLQNALAYYFIKTNQKVNIEECAVHRIDSGTSGLIVFAKNKSVKKQLEAQLQSNKIHRTYQALVWGIIAESHGIIDVPVGRNKLNPMIIQAFPLRDDGKLALTEYNVLNRYKLLTLVECRLQSGRTHQIRIHMQHIGHAIVGDPRYPSNFTFKEIENILLEENITNQLLHAARLEFEHPVTKELVSFNAPLPDSFQNVLNKLSVA